MGFLSDIVAQIRRDLEARPLDESSLMAYAMNMPPPRGFVGALTEEPPAIIAEIKRASPSAGAIGDAEPTARAAAYEEGGAAAISVLTEARHFDGSLADLRAVHLATSRAPVLRKDFLIHPAQLIEARAAGADAVLLIAACLTDHELAAMLAAAGDLGLSALVEAHSDEDLERAVGSGAPVVGVNARDLETLEVDGEGALARLRRIPAERVSVFESGISTREQVERAVDAGATAVLVGEALMRAPDPGAKIRELLGREAA